MVICTMSSSKKRELEIPSILPSIYARCEHNNLGSKKQSTILHLGVCLHAAVRKIAYKNLVNASKSKIQDDQGFYFGPSL